MDGAERSPEPSPWIGEALRNPAFLADPYPTYDRLRTTAAAHFLEHGGDTGGMWLVTRYDDVDFVLRNPSIGKDITRARNIEPSDDALPNMLGADPPEHTRLRSLVGAAFTPKVVRDLAPRVERIAAELLDAIDDGVEFDLISAFALPLPVIVIAELLGVPLDRREDFQRWSSAFFEGSDATQASAGQRERTMQAQRELAGFFAALVAERRHDPRDDMISTLVEVSDGTDRLSPEEMIGTCILLLIAGHETTANLIGNGMLAFLRHPDEWARLVDDPELAPSAVEEILRFESPVQRATFRIALDEVEVGGITIERGQQVSAVIGAANRDPDRFVDPYRFDIGREPNRHLAFGKGIHFCLGAPLARLEGAIAFRALAERFPSLEGAQVEVPAWRPTTVFRGLKHLHLAGRR